MNNKIITSIVLLVMVFGANCQENAIKNLSPSLIECYDGDLYEKWNLLPHNMETLIAIIRKIEDAPNLNMNLRILSAAILHRFRQDGIVKNPRVKAQQGLIMPYAPLGKQFFRHAQTLRVIPGNAINFPNNSLSALERCSLHSMLSSSIDIFERGDESRVCKVANYAFRRWGRSVDRQTQTRNVKDDVETLSPEQLEMLMHRGEDKVDPNSLYPALPPNHPSSARLTDLPPHSRCPTENGVVKTTWGTVSGGSVIAGIAAGLEPQMMTIGELIRQQVEQRVLSSYPTEASLDNRFLGTLAGDLAEVALDQGPQQSDRFTLGADGNWNSSTQPLYYFLNANEHLQMTGAEIRGDLDGLILANKVPEYIKKFSGLKLSQVLDMYYSKRGFFNLKNRACNRRVHLPELAPTQTLISQTHSAAIVLSTGIATATFSSEAIEKFAKQAVENLSNFIPTMNNENSCEFTDNVEDNSRPAIDLTIIVDTTWAFETIRPILAQLLSGLDISKFGSNFTIISGHDGSILINSSNSIIDFHSFNQSQYDKHTKGFDLPRSMERLRTLQTWKLNEEKRLGLGGGKSDVVLIVPYQGSLSQSDKEFCYETLKGMREQVPDAVVLFLTYGPKDRWSDLVLNPGEDIVSVSIGETTDSYPGVDTMQTRIKQVPRRLINSQCGADYEKSGPLKQIIDFVGPNGANFYRIHPNYFMSDDTENPPKVKIQGSASSSLKICTSRELLHVNTTSAIAAADCKSVTSNTYTITMNCEGASYLHECKPYYFSIASNSNATEHFDCTDPVTCRYPDDIKYTISYENLICKSGASAIIITPIFLLTIFTRFF